MKKQTNSTIKAHLIRGAFYLLLLLAVCAIPFALAQRNTTKPKRSQVRQREQSIGERRNGSPANSIVGTNTNDSGPGSLRDALATANVGDTIDATGVSGTILLTSGELQITQSVTINGPGAGTLAVDGNATFRVFDNVIFLTVTISDFTIPNGLGGILNTGGLTLSDSIVSNSRTFNANGGGIANNGTLTVTNSIITGNSAAFGGGIANTGDLTVANSTITGNGASDAGGGMFLLGGNTTVTDSTISDNSATLSGGGIENTQIATTVSNSTISGNSSDFGGGISNETGLGPSTVTISNSTISGNSATGNGGGIGNRSSVVGAPLVTVSNSTLSGNSATGNGGGIYNAQAGTSATIELSNTILNRGSLGENIFNDGGTVTSHGYNLSSDDGGGVLTGPGDQINTDPMLGPLQDNGGPTFTHALLPGSPAIDAGNPSFTPPPVFDQRGPNFDRVVNGRIDIGSFEVQGPLPTPTATPRETPRPRPTATGTPTATPRVTPRPRPTPHPRPTP